MRFRAASLAGLATIVAVTSLASAQVGGTPTTGNPTPGTAQPDPPNLADRITVVGCLQAAARRADPLGSADPNTPSNSRFELAKAARVERVPPGTGGSAAVAAAASTKTYRLEGIDSQFSPFVGAKVEISGEITSGSANPPTLLVEFVQKLAAKCP